MVQAVYKCSNSYLSFLCFFLISHYFSFIISLMSHVFLDAEINFETKTFLIL